VLRKLYGEHITWVFDFAGPMCLVSDTAENLQLRVWLEHDGKRCFVPDSTKHIAPRLLYALRHVVRRNRYSLDSQWINAQIELGKISYVVDPAAHTAQLTLYPGTGYANSKQLDLRVFENFGDTKKMFSNVALDASMVAISFGTHLSPDRRYDLYLPDIFWGRHTRE
jgi:hypothetical protein